MTWSCLAIDHGVTFFPNGKVGPCCQVSADYLKPIEVVTRRDRFQDLKTEFPPSACEKCVQDEYQGLPSYRDFFNSHTTSSDQNIVFLDVRNTNQCNLKCRYCGPHFSNQWAKELNIANPLRHTNIDHLLDDILTDDLQVLYFTGGEPLISVDHWNILDRLNRSGFSKNIKLMYNTNVTVLKYKDINFQEIWDQFANVSLMLSIDAIGEVFNNIRSGANWKDIEANLDALQKFQSNVVLSVSCVLSILNIWHLVDFIKYFQARALPVNFTILQGPDYLALDVIPDDLKHRALTMIDKAIELLDDPKLQAARNMIIRNQNQVLFRQCISHVLLLDYVRKENLFALLPFQDLAKDLISNNNEYR